MANNIIFLYSTKPTIGRVGTPGKTVTMLSDNGTLIHNKYLVGEDEPYETHDESITEKQMEKFKSLLKKYQNKIELLPNNMSYNRMGTFCDIGIGEKQIHGINIWNGLDSKDSKILHSIITQISLILGFDFHSEKNV